MRDKRIIAGPYLPIRQKGAALLILMVVFVLFFISVLLVGIDKASSNLAKHKRTDRALATAKTSLINYALLSDKLMGSPGVGYLPCPDVDGDGLADSPCGVAGESAEGWLPWQTLGDQPYKDGYGVCLRYSVSGNYKINPSSLLVSTPVPTAGHFVIHGSDNIIRLGNVAAEYVLAVVFSPGSTVTGQTRTLGGGTQTQCGSTSINAARNNAVNYLDQLSGVNNAAGTFVGVGLPGSAALPTSNPSVFIQADPEDDYNDRLIWISPHDFVNVYGRMP